MNVQEKKETAEVIFRMIEGRPLQQWEWDDYFSPKSNDAEFESIRSRVWEISEEYPPINPAYYCNEEGMNELRKIAEGLLCESDQS